jgi:hypothetical protein
MAQSGVGEFGVTKIAVHKARRSLCVIEMCIGQIGEREIRFAEITGGKMGAAKGCTR